MLVCRVVRTLRPCVGEVEIKRKVGCGDHVLTKTWNSLELGGGEWISRVESYMRESIEVGIERHWG